MMIIDDEDDLYDDENEWNSSDIIFLPFNFKFKTVVLIVAIVKSTLGPCQVVYPVIYCSVLMERNVFFHFIKVFYSYFCDPIYAIDLILHMMHRQLTDRALRRNYLPKSARLLVLDFISLLPMYRLIVGELCTSVKVWPNILCFNEIIPVYRVYQYFKLKRTHDPFSIIMGLVLLAFIITNALTCVFLMFTIFGFCAKCNCDHPYDWRVFINDSILIRNETKVICVNHSTYINCFGYVLQFIQSRLLENGRFSTITEHFLCLGLVVIGKLIIMIFLVPKILTEVNLRLFKEFQFMNRIKRLISDTKRRNPSITAHEEIEAFYLLMWKECGGVSSIPPIILEMPKHLRIDVRLDLVWVVFHTSPVFRKASMPFKRHLCESVRFDYKLPGEKFFAGPQAHSTMYYIKSGVIQLLSKDDSKTALLSFTSGTLIGDNTFFVPSLYRKLNLYCSSYCKIFYISRREILRAMHKYPADRNIILEQANARLKHARTLYICKQNIKGLDRSEDEGIAWLKRRWWEVNNVIREWSVTHNKGEAVKCEIPPEETVYHCAKYINQLVLCNKNQVFRSMFASVHFPWVIYDDTLIEDIWQKVVYFTILLVLCTYPVIIIRHNIPIWFTYLRSFVDLIYFADLCVMVMSTDRKSQTIDTDFMTLMFNRFKDTYFVLDFLSSIWTEVMVVIMGVPHLCNIVLANRLIKVFRLFTERSENSKNILNPSRIVFLKVFYYQFISSMLMGYFINYCIRVYPEMTPSYWNGEPYCGPEVPKEECDDSNLFDIYSIAYGWSFTMLEVNNIAGTLTDVVVTICVSFIIYSVCLCTKIFIIGVNYMKMRGRIEYQYFVSNLIEHYTKYQIHPNLLRRLRSYLLCHWKYFKGMDILLPYYYHNEPYDIYWKIHGDVACKIIHETRIFHGAKQTMIKELAFVAKFVIVPKGTVIILSGTPIENVVWIVNGFVNLETVLPDGESHIAVKGKGNLLTEVAIFFGIPSMWTYTTISDCELLMMDKHMFFKILQRYPTEWHIYKKTIEEFREQIQYCYKMRRARIIAFQKVYRTFQINKRPQLDHDDNEVVTMGLKFIKKLFAMKLPESKFVNRWYMFRMISVIVLITTLSLINGHLAAYKRYIIIVERLCDLITVMDMFIKSTICFSNEKGIMISDRRTCIKRYLSRTFLIDLIGIMPWYTIIKHYFKARDLTDDVVLTIESLSKFPLIYIVISYFNYLSDYPTIRSVYYQIAKWQLTLILFMFACSQIFVKQCIIINWDGNDNLVNLVARNNCWIHDYFKLNDTPTLKQLNLVYLHSLHLAQCGLFSKAVTSFNISKDDFSINILLFLLCMVCTFAYCYSITMLMLSHRGYTFFRYSVTQLQNFFEEERIEDTIVNRTMSHFRYWWLRTGGLNTDQLIQKRLGSVFRQDLNHYFHSRTFDAVDSILKGGDSIQRQLAGAADSDQLYFLPNDKIMRENDLTPYVYIVNRGKVKIYQNNKAIAKLSKGCMFGQLDSDKPRPIRVSASAAEYADIIQIPVKKFQDTITHEIRNTIQSHPEFKNDYLMTKSEVKEDPEDTIMYLVKWRKSMRLPFMKHQVQAKPSSWYGKWIQVSCLIAPVIATLLSVFAPTMPHVPTGFFAVLIITDIIHFLNMISEFYTTTLSNHHICEYEWLATKRLKQLTFYLDFISFIVPMMSDNPFFHLARILRLNLLRNFHSMYAKSFRTNHTPLIIKTLLLIILFHGAACVWMMFACRSQPEIEKFNPPWDPKVKLHVNFDEWVSPEERNYTGCNRYSQAYYLNGTRVRHFLVPKNWLWDYMVAFINIIVSCTYTNVDGIPPFDEGQIIVIIILTYMLHLVEIVTFAEICSSVYAKLRKLVKYDGQVRQLEKYLKNAGLAEELMESLRQHSDLLWNRQHGYWIPALVHKAPVCLREDIMGALYMHHLHGSPLFSLLPEYLLRQLAAKFNRVIIFPEKYILQEGDINSAFGFIHEGTVDITRNDASGAEVIVAELESNGYFGLLCGLYPNMIHKYSIKTRTVVDLVYLKSNDLFDILDAYPDLKEYTYTIADELRRKATNTEMQYYL